MDLKEALTTIMKSNPEKIPHGAALCVGGNPILDKVREMFQKLNTISFKKRLKAYGSALYGIHGENISQIMIEAMFKAAYQGFKSSYFRPPPYMGDVRFFLAEQTFSFFPNTREFAINLWKNVITGKKLTHLCHFF